VVRPAFQPARPVIWNPLLDAAGRGSAGTTVVDPSAARVLDLGNAIYALMIRTLAQVFAPAPLPRELRCGMGDAASALMSMAARVADVATRLPIGAGPTGFTAALNFDLPGSIGPLVQMGAAQILGERAAELGAAANQLARELPLADVGRDLAALARTFDAMHDRFEAHLGPAVDRVAGLRAPPMVPAAPPPDSRAGDTSPDAASTDAITLRVDARRCIHSRQCVLEAPAVFVAGAPGAWLHPEAATVERCVQVVHNCPSGAITYERHDGGPQEPAPAVNVVRVQENGPYLVKAAYTLPSGTGYRATLCRCGKSKRKPYCDNSHAAAGFGATGEPATRDSEPLAERGGPLTIRPITDGPLQLTGSVEICAGSGRTVQRTRTTLLCRCGGSQDKPFCDGTHRQIDFRSAD
jgi:CDGSH-type Zn-finger protein/uncharacterized Fe-S cluster protein YjdI